MKKIFKSLMAFAFGAFALTSCEDVPQPYDSPNNEDPTQPTEGEYLNETFSVDFGAFEEVTTKGIGWMIDFKTAKASGYTSSDKTNTESQSFLVSPNVDLSKSEGAYLEFEYIFRYKSNDGRDAVLITDNYTGDPATTEWKDITGELTEGSDWSTFSKYSVNIPADYLGKDGVRIALYYDATSKSSRTWEVKNLIMADGTGENDATVADFDLNGTGGGGDDPTGKGTYDDPYDVASAIAKGSAEGVYVKGYIVGFVTGTKLEEGATFSATGASETNVLIAATPDETNVANCMPVQLPKGDIRDKLNLSANAGNLKQAVLLYGDIATYFNVPGVKNTSYAEINGTAIGTKPGGGGGETGDGTYERYENSTVENGTYIIATPLAGASYAVAKPVEAGKAYGWLYVEQATMNGSNQLSVSSEYEFIITKNGSNYTIVDKSGRIYYMEGTYNSFQVATMPSGTLENNYLWSITISDGEVAIKNVDKQKTIQYAPDHTSYGAYDTVDKQLPVLFKKK